MGTDACARSLPKTKLEQIATDNIKSKILQDEILEKLVTPVNADLDTAHLDYAEKLGMIDTELKEASSRLTKLYDVLETGALDLGDQAPRIKEHKNRQERADESSRSA